VKYSSVLSRVGNRSASESKSESKLNSGSNPEARTRPRFTDGIGVGFGVGLGLGDRVEDGVGLDLGVGLDCGRGHVESAVYLESESGLVRTWKHGLGVAVWLGQGLALRLWHVMALRLCCDVAEHGMTWRGVVFNANNIVGQLFGKGGVVVAKYREPDWHMRLYHMQLCWPLVCGCLRLPCRDLAESGNRSAGISPAGTSPKAVIGVQGLYQPRPHNKCGGKIKASYLP